MSLSFVRRIAIAAVALPLLLGGCTDDDPVPKVPETSSPTSPTTESSTAAPVEPTLPPEAGGKGPKAAEAFVRYYFAMVDHARASASTVGLGGIALRSCESCAGVISVIRKVKESGGTITGGDQTVRDIRLSQLGGVKNVVTFRGTISLESTPQEIAGSGDSSLDGTYPAGSVQMDVLVLKGEQGWRFAEWSVIS